MTTTTAIYTPDQLSRLNQEYTPRHIAIIPDGNRRWAKKHAETYHAGHESGASNLIEIVKAGKALGVKTLTFYLFSTENWTRSKEEIGALMWLLQEFLKENCQEMQDQGARLKTIGDLSAFPADVLTSVQETITATAHCNQLDMVLALNYGGRDEIRRALHCIVDHYAEGKLNKEEITEELIASYLDTKHWGDPDLLIRTSGEMRISNFLLWQLSYTEIYSTELLWPEFKAHDLLDAVVDFQKRERRLGGT